MLLERKNTGGKVHLDYKQLLGALANFRGASEDMFPTRTVLALMLITPNKIYNTTGGKV